MNSRREWTLRDVRRAAARGLAEASALDGKVELRQQWGGRTAVAHVSVRPGTSIQVIDRLIGILGADAAVSWAWLEDGEVRPKDTDEVAEQSGDPSEDSALHGGDGASGEVEESTPTRGENSNEAETAHGPGAAGQDASQGEPPEHATREGEDDPRRESADASSISGQSQGGKATGAEGEDRTPATDRDGDDSPDGDTPGHEAHAAAPPGAAGPPVETVDPKNDARDEREEAASTPHADGRSGESRNSESGAAGSRSATPRVEYGGCHARLERSRTGIRDPKQRRAARRLARRLSRLFASWTVGGLDESPRLDPRRLVEHLVSRRGQLARCVRRERQRELILLLVDVSGSCSAHAEDTVAAIAEVARHDDRVVLISHSNGVPLQIDGGRSGERFVLPEGVNENGYSFAYSDLETVCLQWWRDLVARYRVVGTVAFGDNDAAWVYAVLASLAPLVWLDSYTKKVGVRDMTRLIRSQSWPRAARERIRYFVGVGDAASADEALREVEHAVR